jgi:signal transduction histidine kinase
MHMDEIRKAMAAAIATLARVDSIPILLRLATEITGVRVAILARVADDVWTVCASHENSSPAASTGGGLPIGQPLRLEIDPVCRIIAIPSGSGDEAVVALTDSPIECSIAMPIVLSNDRCFGLLCAIDPAPPGLPEPRTVSKMTHLSSLIAQQLDQLEMRDREQSAILDERAMGQLREQFIAILGHDLRTPLHAISMSSEMLTRRLTDAWGSAIACRIKENARRMSCLIEDVLDFARARLGGGIEIEMAEVENINQGLATVVQELRDAQPDCQIISSISVNRSVRCDLGRIQQVACNLLGNALTHGLAHSPVKITARADEHDLVLEVWNAGEPIPPESIDKIFEPFWRHSTSETRNGLGLGLHICSHIVRAHEGNISVTSTRETGTLFTARLPLSPLVSAESIFDAAECA